MLSSTSFSSVSSQRAILQLFQTPVSPSDAGSEPSGQERFASVSLAGDRINNAISEIVSIIMDMEGNSTVSLSAGNDVTAGIATGAGDDTLSAKAGRIRGVYSGSGNDVISAYASASREPENHRASVDIVDGGDGDDVLEIASDGGVDRTYGGKGNDTIIIESHEGSDRTNGGDGDDVIDIDAGSKYAMRTYGDEGDDRISIRAGNVWVTKGGEGNDTISVTAEGLANTISGGEGNDIIEVSAASILNLSGGKGDDRISVNSTRGAVAVMMFTEGDGRDVVETNSTIEIRRFSEDGTFSPANIFSFALNKDGSLTLSFEGSNDTITVTGTGDLAGKELEARMDSNGSIFVGTKDGPNGLES